MRAISENLLKKIQSDTRAYDIMLTVYHRYIDADGNISFDTSTDYSSNAELLGVSGLQGATTGYLQLGKTFVSEIDFSLTKNAICRVGDKVKLWLDFGEGDTITLATAYVDTVSHDQWQSNFTAYDKMMQLNKAYISRLTYPASASAVVDEICEKTGLELEPFVFECNPTLKVAPVSPNTDYNGNSVYYSYREILGYIALANASNVVIDEETERLKFVKYTDSGSVFDYNKTIRRTINNENYVINAIKVSDTGYSEGNEKGEFEVFFPLKITQPNEYIYSYLTTFFVGLSYIGMTAQKQGYGIYQIGDLVNYADFDGEIYTFAVMGVKYDFSGGYFTEQLYSLAPSEMEAEYSGGIYVGQSNTNIKNPVIISEKSKSYLKYEYTSLGYVKGDEASYGTDINDIIVNGYIFGRDSSFYVGNEANNSYNYVAFPQVKSYDGKLWSNYTVSVVLQNVDSYGNRRFAKLISYYDENGQYQEKYGDQLSTKDGSCVLFPLWEVIYAPTDEFANGYVYVDNIRLAIVKNGIVNNVASFPTYDDVKIPFASINEYNSAVKLTNSPLVLYDVTQNALQIVEGNKYGDLPEIGTADTLYVTYQPPAVYKYSMVTQSYYCVGRNYKEIQRIVSTTKPDDNEVATYKVPIVFDVRTKAEWELEANTVFPKGFVILEQEPETREKTRIKIANGIDKLSELAYNGLDESIIDGKADKSELQAHIDDKSNPHEVTKEQIGLSNVENKSSADILSELSIGGTQILRNTQTAVLAEITVPALWSEGAWRKASGTNGVWESIDITDSPEPFIEKGWRIASVGESTSTMQLITITQNNIPLVVGKEYILSCYARGKGTFMISAGGSPAKAEYTAIDNTEWKKLTLTFTTQGAAEYSVYFGVRYQGDSVEVCGMKLEVGNRATSWNICPKDIADHEDRIKALEAAILSLGGET